MIEFFLLLTILIFLIKVLVALFVLLIITLCAMVWAWDKAMKEGGYGQIDDDN